MMEERQGECFRPLRRRKQELSREECLEILCREKRAALGVNGELGYPYVLPLNFYYDSDDGHIYFHCGPKGHKMEAMQKSDQVCFTVWTEGVRPDSDWAFYVKSVIIFGRAFRLWDQEQKLAKIRRLANKYFPSQAEVEEEIVKAFARVEIVGIKIVSMTGKLVHER
ncbi:MAG: pyridoxamine 5'-phosphate oxidase family protein [Desulfovibrio sp.]|nr:pyridoxamine 5'-phosphate oxidase family protein [Desulfovibrio sp.]